jgi:hypothetical protein
VGCEVDGGRDRTQGTEMAVEGEESEYREKGKRAERRGRTGRGADTEASRMRQNDDDASGMV